MALYSWSYMARGRAPPPLSTGGAEYLTWGEILFDRGRQRGFDVEGNTFRSRATKRVEHTRFPTKIGSCWFIGVDCRVTSRRNAVCSSSSIVEGSSMASKKTKNSLLQPGITTDRGTARPASRAAAHACTFAGIVWKRDRGLVPGRGRCLLCRQRNAARTCPADHVIAPAPSALCHRTHRSPRLQHALSL
jgi:hypothetical protein